MNLTRYTDYSLRVLIFLALDPGRRRTIPEISDAYGVSRHHMVKVAHNLGRLGYVETIRGRSGGIRLAREPCEVSVGEVVRAVEPSLDLLECFDAEASECPITPSCRLKGALVEAREAFLRVLDGYTLGDIASNPHRLKKLLFRAES